MNAASEEHGQSFTATETTSWTSIGMQSATASQSGVVNLYICNGEEDWATCSVAPDYTQTNTAIATNSTNDVNSWNIPLTTPFAITEGSQYTYHLEWVSGTMNFKIGLSGDNSAYQGGTVFCDTCGGYDQTTDWIFGSTVLETSRGGMTNLETIST